MGRSSWRATLFQYKDDWEMTGDIQISPCEVSVVGLVKADLLTTKQVHDEVSSTWDYVPSSPMGCRLILPTFNHGPECIHPHTVSK